MTGVDCGWWNAPDTLRGTDSATAGTQVRVMAGFKLLIIRQNPLQIPSGSDIVMLVALTVGIAILSLVLACLIRHRQDQDTDLG